MEKWSDALQTSEQLWIPIHERKRDRQNRPLKPVGNVSAWRFVLKPTIAGPMPKKTPEEKKKRKKKHKKSKKKRTRKKKKKLKRYKSLKIKYLA